MRRFLALARPLESDPIPASFLWLSILVSSGAVVLASFLGWTGFLQSVAATLALLGPGLITTHVVIKAKRQARTIRRARPAVTRTLEQCEKMMPLINCIANALEQELPNRGADKAGKLAAQLEGLKESTLRGLHAFAITDDWRTREIRLTPGLLDFPDLILVDKLAKFVDSVCDTPRLRLEATAAAEEYKRQYVVTCAWSDDPDMGALNTSKSVDDLRHSIRPGVFLGPRHNPRYTAGAYELVRCLSAVGVGVVQVLDALEDELPKALLAEPTRMSK